MRKILAYIRSTDDDLGRALCGRGTEGHRQAQSRGSSYLGAAGVARASTEVVAQGRARELLHTSSIRILASRRINRSEINVRYRLLMRPDKEHREANWFPIRCRGWVWIGKLNTGRLIGDIKRYKCWTVNP